MLFSIETNGEQIKTIPEENHASLDILERDDLEEWIIREHAFLWKAYGMSHQIASSWKTSAIL